MVCQRARVVHDPYSRRRRGIGVVHGVLHRKATECLIKAGEKRLGIGREIDFELGVWCRLPKPCEQYFPVVVENTFVRAHQRQAHSLLRQRGDITFKPQPIRRAKEDRVGNSSFAVGHGVARFHAGLSYGETGLPSAVNSIDAGILGAGLGIGSTPGLTCARLNT